MQIKENNFWIKPKSSNIEAFGYNYNTKELVVMFKNYALYVYQNVPVHNFEVMKNIKSKGWYLNRWIKNKFKYKKVESYKIPKENEPIPIIKVDKIKKKNNTHTTGKGLPPVKTRFDNIPKDELRKIASKGGSMSTPAKRWAARLREMKKRLNAASKQGRAGDRFYKKMIDLMEDPECSILDLRMFAEQIKAEIDNPRDKIALLRVLNEIHKSHHGTKIMQQNMNLNVNLDMTKPLTEKEQEELIVFIEERRKRR